MSNTIDTRIVEMLFDNSQFEAGVKQSMHTLTNLKENLDMDISKSGSGLQKVTSVIMSLPTSFKNVAGSVGGIISQISILDRAVSTVKNNIAGMAVNLTKELTIGQVSGGFAKYENEISSVQTIMAATGKSIDEVTASLEKLNWFTDETSYNYVDMVSNIGKFTSSGVELDDAITSMMGIADWAALAGQNATAAGRAMYNLSQAMGTGTVQLMDWKSIENANMDTKQFKELAIETAKEMGTLRSDGTTLDGKETVNYTNFRSTLQKDWFTSDVLIATLKKYGEYAEEVYKIANEQGLTASEVMEQLNIDGMELGKTAFEAAQKAKTFTDAINATKDAVSTGWMKTFRLIIGDYEEASEFWTKVSQELWEIFASGGERRNQVLTEWRELGGREKMVAVLTNAYRTLKDVVDATAGAIKGCFKSIEATDLMNAITWLEGAVQSFYAFLWSSNEYADGFPVIDQIRDISEGIGSALNIAWKALQAIFGGLGGLASGAESPVKWLLAKAAEIGRKITALSQKLDDEKFFEEFQKKIQEKVDAFTKWFKDIWTAITDFKISDLIDWFKGLKEEVGNLKVSPILAIIVSALSSFGLKKLIPFLNSLQKTDDKIEEYSKKEKKSGNIFTTLIGKIKEWLTDGKKLVKLVATAGIIWSLADSINKVADAVYKIGSLSIGQIIQGLLGVVAVFGLLVGGLFALKKFAPKLTDINSLSGIIGSMTGLAAILNMAVAPLTTLATVPWDTLLKAGAILVGLATLVLALKYLITNATDKIGVGLFREKIAGILGAMAAVAGILMAASVPLLLLNLVSWWSILKAVSILIGLGAVVLGLKYLMTTVKDSIGLSAFRGKIAGVLGAMAALSGILFAAAVPLLLLNLVSWWSILKAISILTGLGALVLALKYLTTLTKKKHVGNVFGGEIASVLGAMAALSGILLAAAVPLVLFNIISWFAVLKGLSILTGLGLLVMGLKALVTLTGKYGRDIFGGKIASVLGAMAALSGILLAAAVPLVLFNFVSWFAVLKGLSILTGLGLLVLGLKALVGITKKNKQGVFSGEIAGVVGAMAALAGILTAAAVPLVLFNFVSWWSILKGLSILTGLGALVLGLKSLVNLTNKNYRKVFSGEIAGVVGAMAALAGILTAAAVPLVLLNFVSWWSILKGVAVLSGLGLLVLGLKYLMTNVKDAYKQNVFRGNIANVLGAMAALAAIMDIMAIAVVAIGDVSWGSVFKADAAVAALAVIALLVGKLSSIKGFNIPTMKMVKLLGMMAALALILGLMVTPITLISAIPWDGLGKVGAVMGGLAAVMVLVSLLGKFGVGTIAKGAAALLIVLGALATGFSLIVRAVGGAVESAFSSLWQCASTYKNAAALLVGVSDSKLTSMATTIATIYTTLSGIEPKDLKADEFAEELFSLGAALLLFGACISSVGGGGIEALSGEASAAVTNIKTICGTLKEIEDSGVKMGDYAVAIANIGAAFAIFGWCLAVGTESLDSTSGENGEITDEQVSTAIQGFHKMVKALADNMPDSALIQTIATYAEGGGNDLTSFALGIVSIAGALATYGDAVSGLNTDQITTANGVLTKITGLQNTLTLQSVIGGLVELFSFGTLDPEQNIQKFTDNMTGLGQGLGTYLAAIGTAFGEGLTIEQVDTAMSALERLAGLNQKLQVDSTNVWFTELVGVTEDLGDFAVNMGNLGDGLRQFVLGLNGATQDANDATKSTQDAKAAFTKLDEADINLALGVIERLVSANHDLQVDSTNVWFTSLIGATENLGSFASNMGELGKGIYQFTLGLNGATQNADDATKSTQDANAAFTKLGKTDIDGALDVVERLAKVDTNLGVNEHSLWGWITGAQNLDTFGDNIGKVGSGINTFMTNTGSVNVERFTALVTQLQNLASIQVEDLDDHTFSLSALPGLLYDVAIQYNTLAEKAGLSASNIGTLADNAGKFNGINPENMSAVAALVTICTDAQERLSGITKSNDTHALSDIGEALGDIAWNFNSVSAYLGQTDYLNFYYLASGIDALTTAANNAKGLTAEDFTSLFDFMEVLTGEDFATLSAAEGGIFADGFFVSFGENFQNGIESTGTLIETLCGTLATKANTAITGYTESFTSSGRNFGFGLAKGIRGFASTTTVVAAASALAKYALNAVNNTLGVESPSRETMQTGEYFDEGLAIGIDNASGMVEKSSSNVGKAATAMLAKTMNSTFKSELEQFGKDGGSSIGTGMIGALSNTVVNHKTDGTGVLNVLGGLFKKAGTWVASKITGVSEETITSVVDAASNNNWDGVTKTLTDELDKSTGTMVDNYEKNTEILNDAKSTYEKTVFGSSNDFTWDGIFSSYKDDALAQKIAEGKATREEVYAAAEALGDPSYKLMYAAQRGGYDILGTDTKSQIDALNDAADSVNKSSTRRHTKVISSVDISKAQSIFTAINAIGDKVTMLGDAVSSMQIVMDSGVMVGQIEHKVDQRLGQIAALKGRGL